MKRIIIAGLASIALSGCATTRPPVYVEPICATALRASLERGSLTREEFATKVERCMDGFAERIEARRCRWTGLTAAVACPRRPDPWRK